MTGEIEARIRKARRSLAAARRLAEDGDHDFAVARAYYAMFYLAEAMLLTRDLRFSRHAAVIAAVAQHFVRPAEFAIEHLDALRAGFELRQLADYISGAAITARQAQETLSRAQAFLDAAEAHLRRQGG